MLSYLLLPQATINGGQEAGRALGQYLHKEGMIMGRGYSGTCRWAVTSQRGLSPGGAQLCVHMNHPNLSHASIPLNSYGQGWGGGVGVIVSGAVSSSDGARGERALQKMMLALSRARQSSDYLAFLRCIPNEQGMLYHWLATPMLPGTKPSRELKQEQGTAHCFPALPLPSSQPCSTEGSR